MKAIAASVCTGLAAWCSLGTIGFTSTNGLATRVGLLPPWWLLPALVGGCLAAIRLTRRSPSQLSPLFGSAVVLLPWLPFPMPAAALLWTGPFMVSIWLLVVGGCALERFREARSVRLQADRQSPAKAGHYVELDSPWLTTPSRAPIAAATLALALYAASAWWLRPILPDGDSPHYLILAQSLITDHDIQIENNHRRGDYLAYSLQASQPDYLRRGVNGQIYSIHAPGLPVIIAPAMWMLGYPGVVAFLGIIAAISTALVWRLSYAVTASASASWFGWACCALTTPFFFQATQVFPDGVAATGLLLGTLPLTLADRRLASWPEEAVSRTHASTWLLAGASLALLPWLQTRLAIVALMAAICLCLRIRSARQFLIFAAVPTASAIAWFSFFYAVYGAPNPTAPYGSFTQTSVANLQRGLPGILFDQQFGLFINAPVHGLVLAGIVVAASRMRRWSWELLALIVPYAVGVGMYQHWWGGASPPARLLAPIMLVLAVGSARVWHDARSSTTRTVYLVGLAVSVLIAALLLGPDEGRLLLNFRDGVALWVEWANDLVNMPRGLPSLFTDDSDRVLLEAAIWGGCVLAGWFVLQALGRRRDSEQRNRTPALSSTTIWCLSAVPMIAFTLVWRVAGVQPLTPAKSQVGLLRHASSLRPNAYDFNARRVEPSNEALSRLRIRSNDERPRTSPAQLLSALAVPAGTYQVEPVSSGVATGTLTLRIGDTPLPFWTSAASQLNLSAPSVRFPIDVRSLVVEGDREALNSMAAVELTPVRSTLSSDRAVARGTAHRGVRYATADALFVDDNAYPEPTGFWVAGGRAARIVTSSAEQTLHLLLRNAPVDNVITVDIDGARQEIVLRPGEEWTMTLRRSRPGPYASIRVTSRNGFRPSEAEPGNRDLRYLGCWVEIR